MTIKPQNAYFTDTVIEMPSYSSLDNSEQITQNISRSYRNEASYNPFIVDTSNLPEISCLCFIVLLSIIITGIVLLYHFG